MSGTIDGLGYSRGNRTGTVGGGVGSGQVLQVILKRNSATNSIVNTSETAVEAVFHRISGVSAFICHTVISMGNYADDNNTDGANPTLRLEIDVGAGFVDFTARNQDLRTDGFYDSDVPGWRTTNIYNSMYEIFQIQGMMRQVSNSSDGAEVTIKVVAGSGTAGMYINTSARGEAAVGGQCSLTIYEVTA